MDTIVVRPPSMWGTIFGAITSAARALNRVILSGENLADYLYAETGVIKDQGELDRIPIQRELAAALKELDKE